MSFIAQLSGKRCLVIGAGVTGQALKVALENFGATALLFDEKNTDQTIQTLPTDIHLAITSPGWRPEHQIFADLKKQGVQVISEIDLSKCSISLYCKKNTINKKKNRVAITR